MDGRDGPVGTRHLSTLVYVHLFLYVLRWIRYELSARCVIIYLYAGFNPNCLRDECCVTVALDSLRVVCEMNAVFLLRWTHYELSAK